jgi:2-polyprenyl-3-methyl-5-hydroxy-6-metoxy-1,4-benzoquinol methylase
MSFWLKYRTHTPELMDDPNADSEMLSRTFSYIDFVNRSLGGYSVLFSGLDIILKSRPQKSSWRMLDLGCGRGDQLQQLSVWAEKQNYQVELFGLDNNAEAIRLATAKLENKNVQFIMTDALSLEIDYAQFDVVIGTLFLHHLSNEQIVHLLSNFNKSGAHVLINDLHRNRFALFLFRIFTFISKAPSMARYDGLVSIRKGFRAAELRSFAIKSGYKNFSLQWKWAFRYQLLLFNESSR